MKCKICQTAHNFRFLERGLCMGCLGDQLRKAASHDKLLAIAERAIAVIRQSRTKEWKEAIFVVAAFDEFKKGGGS